MRKRLLHETLPQRVPEDLFSICVRRSFAGLG